MATEQTSELVTRAQRGDTEACAALYEQHAPAVFRFLRSRLPGQVELAEDLTADVFVAMFDKLDRYVERGLPITAWLYRIARYRLIDYVRTQKRAVMTPLEDAHAVAEPRAESAFGQMLDRQILAPVLARLTPDQRHVIELRFLAGHGVAETAVLSGHSEYSVKKLQVRGLASLRRQLIGTGGAAGRRAMLAA